MSSKTDSAFESIESAHDFIHLLAETVAEAKQELAFDVERESVSSPSRRLEALRVAHYNLAKLQANIQRTSRILNDLRTLRRLLFEERKGPASISHTQMKAVPPPKTLVA